MPETLMCDPKLFEKDLSGRIYIVTGANSGTGFATSKQLAEQGATVIGACRRVDAGKAVFAKETGLRGTVEIMELDLASLESVRQFAENFLAKHDRLDGLINNAGVMATPEGKTKDGFETQFGINYIGHFLLTELLLDTLKASAPSRIVCLSSVAHAGMRGIYGEIDFEDPNFETREYDPNIAYAQSKLGNVLHALNLSQRLEGTGVSAFSVHPGWVRTNLMRNAVARFVQNVLTVPFSKALGIMSPFEGSQSTLHCLLDDDAPKHSGAYFSQNAILYEKPEDRPGGWPLESPNPHANDLELAEKLYQHSLKWTGLA